MLAAAAAPAIVRIGSLMPVKAPSGLWVPDAALSDSLLTISDITNEALMILANSLNFARSMNRQYDMPFASQGAIQIRRPARFVV